MMQERLEETLRRMGRDRQLEDAAPRAEREHTDAESPASSLESRLEEACLEPEILAAWIDGVAPSAEVDRVEAHLAACRACRDLVADITAYPAQAPRPRDVETGITTRRFRRHAPWLAAAALVMMAVSAFLVASWDARLGELGVPFSRSLTAPAAVAEMRDALDGEWPAPSFAAFAADSGEIVLRGAEAPRTPQPLEPRWNALRTRRPAIKIGSVSTPTIDAPLRVLMVDSSEEVVATFILSPAPGSEEETLETGWPEHLPDLAPDLYAWKVSVENLDIAASSAWVPFRVLDPERIEVLERRLDGLGDFEAAFELAKAGLFDDAAARLDELPDSALKERLMAGLERARLGPSAGAGDGGE